MHDQLAAKYKLKCTHGTCHGVRFVEQNFAVGWAVGDVVPFDPSNPAYAKCPICSRYDMRVIDAPEPPAPPGPKGFTRVPTR
jgi:hypothetical protein